MLRAVAVMTDAHPRGRAVAASHGDVIPVLLAALSSAFAVPRPRHVGRGGPARRKQWLRHSRHFPAAAVTSPACAR
jgi:hypothetical protein